jgi:tryptophan 2,3-dioxygenase
MSKEKVLSQIEEKYEGLGENSETYLNGLLHAKPITYWDYVQVDTLLSLQKPRTNFKDEEIFIMYHQVTELVQKMLLHEIKQMVEEPFDEDIWKVKVTRINRYTSMLITSFDVMKYGMDYDDYNTFRSTLTPASGFQSAQFREIELYCTRLENLTSKNHHSKVPDNPSIDDYFNHIYWLDAGMNHKTREKSLTLRLFEEKYLDGFKRLAHNLKENTLEEKILHQENISEELTEQLREFDKLYNIDWPIVHLETAQHYLDQKGENKEATGGSEWKKYLHPKYQQRRFFPSLWSEEEINNWGK